MMNKKQCVLIIIFALQALNLSSLCEVFWRPHDDIRDHLVELINQEQDSIYIAVYALNEPEIIDALIKASGRGVKIILAVDHKGSSLSGYGLHNFKDIFHAGIDVYVYDPKPVGKFKIIPIMHNKIVVFGRNSKYQRPLAWTGSFNFTPTASRYHYENALFIDNPAAINEFKQCVLDIVKAPEVYSFVDFLINQVTKNNIHKPMQAVAA